MPHDLQYKEINCFSDKKKKKALLREEDHIGGYPAQFNKICAWNYTNNTREKIS